MFDILFFTLHFFCHGLDPHRDTSHHTRVPLKFEAHKWQNGSSNYSEYELCLFPTLNISHFCVVALRNFT